MTGKSIPLSVRVSDEDAEFLAAHDEPHASLRGEFVRCHVVYFRRPRRLSRA